MRDPQAPLKPGIVELLAGSEVPVIVLVAPAGFGKTSIAEAYGRRFSECVLLRASPGMTADELLGDIDQPAQCTILDAAERLDDMVWREVLERLVAMRPHDGAIIVCTRREPFGFYFSDVVAPHNLMVLRRRDLEFTLNEIRDLVPKGAEISEAAIHAIRYLTAGWPLPALALIRLATRGWLSDSYSVADPRLSDIFDWLEVNALNTLPAELRDILFRCVASRDLTTRDFDEIFPEGQTRHDLRLYRNAQRAVIGIAGEIRVQRLLALLVSLRHAGTLERYARKACDEFLARGEGLRAVRALIGIGDLAGAAETLDSLPFEETHDLSGYAYPGLELEYFAGTVPPYERYPLLWLQLVPGRIHVVPAIRLAREGARIVDANGISNERVRRWLLSTVATLFVEAGDLRSAENYALLLLDDEQSAADAAVAADLAQIWIAYAHGRYREVLNRWARTRGYLEPYPAWYALHLRVIVNAQICLGDLPGTQEVFDTFVSFARLGANQSFAAEGATVAATLAWLAMDGASFSSYRDELA
ncbi:MAG: hypothetical protein JO263_05650, partial [Candidatus Eremiobacteraeota bacterium]|nr:hypothetical protein [Candidatus Eremiobacteraeota bacterium]